MELKYYAFISYNSKDTEWGKRLQRKLEHYRMPSTLCRERGWKRTPIRPVFFAPTDIQPGALSDELKDNSTPWLQALPGGAGKCSIKAEIAGNSTTWPQPGSSTEAPISIRALSMADRILIDWPGTLLYNISIPVMAPFVFFHEFLNEQ